MPRQGLDPELITRYAAQLVDANGAAQLTLKAVADAAGVRPPSLYAHVKDINEIRGRVAELAYRDLYQTISPVAVGLEGEAAMRAIGIAYRSWANAHPGLYEIIEPSPPVNSPAAAQLLELILAVLRGYQLEQDAAIHAARMLRSAIHGFIALEAGGGFGIDVDVDSSYGWMLEALDRGFRPS